MFIFSNVIGDKICGELENKVPHKKATSSTEEVTSTKHQASSIKVKGKK